MSLPKSLAAISLCSIVSVSMIGCGDNVGANEAQCDVSGHACTWLGMAGKTGFNGDGHDRLDTLLYWTMDTLFAKDGTVWFIDWNNHLVRKVGLDGKVRSMVGWHDPVFPGDGDAAAPTLEKTTGAPGGDLQLNHPTDLAQTADGTILLMAWHNHKLRKVDPDTGLVNLISGGGAGFKGDGGPCAKALFKQPSRLALDEHENVFVLDQQNQRIRMIEAATQNITTVVGSGMQGYADGPALTAQLNFQIGDNPQPSGGLVYRDHALYIGDTENNRIRKVDLVTNMVTTIAGTGTAGFGGDDGPATSAMLYHPRDLEFGPEGDLYIADTDNSRVRAIDLTTGVIRTVVGTDTAGLDPEDDHLATQTKLNRPFSIDFDPDGNLFVSDSLNSRLLKVTK